MEALQTETVLEALTKVRAVNELAYQKYRSRIQGLKKKPFFLSFMDKQTKPPRPPRYSDQDSGGEAGNDRPGKADLFIEMVKRWAEIFTDESTVVYVSFTVEPVDKESGEVLPPHVETYPMNSDKFQSKAGREFYQRYGTVVGDSAMKEALSVLAAEADEGATEEVSLRCAMPPNTNKVYVEIVLHFAKVTLNEIPFLVSHPVTCPRIQCIGARGHHRCDPPVLKIVNQSLRIVAFVRYQPFERHRLHPLLSLTHVRCLSRRQNKAQRIS